MICKKTGHGYWYIEEHTDVWEEGLGHKFSGPSVDAWVIYGQYHRLYGFYRVDSPRLFRVNDKVLSGFKKEF